VNGYTGDIIFRVQIDRRPVFCFKPCKELVSYGGEGLKDGLQGYIVGSGVTTFKAWFHPRVSTR